MSGKFTIAVLLSLSLAACKKNQTPKVTCGPNDYPRPNNITRIILPPGAQVGVSLASMVSFKGNLQVTSIQPPPGVFVVSQGQSSFVLQDLRRVQDQPLTPQGVESVSVALKDQCGTATINIPVVRGESARVAESLSKVLPLSDGSDSLPPSNPAPIAPPARNPAEDLSPAPPSFSAPPGPPVPDPAPDFSATHSR